MSKTRTANELLLTDPPTDINYHEIFDLLPESAKASLSLTCRFFYNIHSQIQLNGKVEAVMQLIKQGKNTELFAMLDEDPGLILTNSKGLTPFQLAFKMLDAELCLQMKPYFEAMPHGLYKMKQQIENLSLLPKKYTFKRYALSLFTGHPNWDDLIDGLRQQVAGMLSRNEYPVDFLLEACSSYTYHRKYPPFFLYESAEKFSIYVIGCLQRAAPLWLRKFIQPGFQFGEDEPEKGLGYERCIIGSGSRGKNWSYNNSSSDLEFLVAAITINRDKLQELKTQLMAIPTPEDFIIPAHQQGCTIL